MIVVDPTTTGLCSVELGLFAFRHLTSSLRSLGRNAFRRTASWIAFAFLPFLAATRLAGLGVYPLFLEPSS